jgi:hypothetical protein
VISALISGTLSLISEKRLEKNCPQDNYTS